MKKKALTATLCLAVATTTLLASCTAGNTQLQFSPNWYKNTSVSAEGATGLTEQLSYDVTFTAGDGLNSGKYEVEYCVDENGNTKAGSYTTSLTANINSTPQTYTLTASCTLPVLFSYGDDTVWHEDKMTSTVVFLKTDTKLQPIYSQKRIQSYTPLTGDIGSITDCYNIFDYESEIEYTEDGGASKSMKVTDYQGTFLENEYSSTNKIAEPAVKSDYYFGIDRSKHTYLDNEQLFFALRGLSNSAMKSTSYVNSYNLSLGRVCNLVLSAKEQGDSAEFKNTTFNGTPLGEGKTIAYNAVTLALNEKNRGPALEMWYAQTVDDSSNTYRNVMLKLKETLAYSMGTLTYSLTSATFN